MSEAIKRVLRLKNARHILKLSNLDMNDEELQKEIKERELSKILLEIDIPYTYDDILQRPKNDALLAFISSCVSRVSRDKKEINHNYEKTVYFIGDTNEKLPNCCNCLENRCWKGL